MNLIDDRVLLSMEPAVFIEAGAAAVTLMSIADAEVAGTSLTSASADFESAQIDDGHVGVVNGVAIEVLGRVQATELTVSLPRASIDDDGMPPGDGETLAFKVLTFAPLIARVQADVIASLGPRAAGDGDAEPLAPGTIINQSELANVIALRTLEQAFATAAAAGPDEAALQSQAALYRKRAEFAAQQFVARVDLDGDGVADASRALRVAVLMRS